MSDLLLGTSPDLLPDCRSRERRGAKIGIWNIYWIPLYCGNCGKQCGQVPELNTTFAFYLCDPCFDKHGAVTGYHVEPDRVFWARVNAEMMEKYGRILTPTDLQDVVDAGLTPLASLLREGV